MCLQIFRHLKAQINKEFLSFLLILVQLFISGCTSSVRRLKHVLLIFNHGQHKATGDYDELS